MTFSSPVATTGSSRFAAIKTLMVHPLGMKPSRFCIHYASQSGGPSSGHRTGKGQSSSQFPRRVVPQSVLTIRQVYSSPMIVRSCLKSCTLRFSIMQTKNFQMSKLGLEKGRRTRDQIANISGFERKQGNFRKISLFHRLC